MELGIVGLPNVGKSTLFNAITKAGAQCANYPFCTIEPNVGVVDVYDERLEVLAKIYKTKKITPAQIKFVDIAGLVKGASEGEGLGNKFLSHIREMDAIIHVVRCFENEKIIHIEGKVDPLRDIETITLELILADIETVTKRLQKTEKLARSNDITAQKEKLLLEKILQNLSQQISVRSMVFEADEKEMVKSFFLISDKPVIYVANTSENPTNTELENIQKISFLAAQENAQAIPLCSKIEEELISLSQQERQMFIEELGLNHSGLEKLIVASYFMLGLISFLTAGEKEVRAWTIKKGTLAPQAAGKIHTDFERGFIKADVCKYEDLIEAGDFNKAKEKGKVISAGKDYLVHDGDVVIFKFNV